MESRWSRYNVQGLHFADCEHRWEAGSRVWVLFWYRVVSGLPVCIRNHHRCSCRWHVPIHIIGIRYVYFHFCFLFQNSAQQYCDLEYLKNIYIEREMSITNINQAKEKLSQTSLFSIACLRQVFFWKRQQFWNVFKKGILILPKPWISTLKFVFLKIEV